MGKRGRRSSAASFEPEARCGGIRAAEARRGNLFIFSFAALAPPRKLASASERRFQEKKIPIIFFYTL